MHPLPLQAVCHHQLCLRLCGPGTSSSRGTWELVRKAESGFAANKTPGVQSQSGSDTTQIAALFPYHPPTAEPLLCPDVYTGGLRFLSGLRSAFRPHLLCAVSPQTKENLTLSRAPYGSYPAAVCPEQLPLHLHSDLSWLSAPPCSHSVPRVGTMRIHTPPRTSRLGSRPTHYVQHVCTCLS